MKKLINWTISIGPYPGVLFGMRDYNYDNASVVQDDVEYTTKDRVIYFPFIMVIFAFVYAKPIKTQ
jgi:hypothetical protein